jgi:hypothetical protein
MIKFLYSIVLVLIVTFGSYAQNISLGSWNVLNLKYNHDQKWSVFGEAQLRSLKFYDNFHYYEYKGGINYSARRNVKLTLGTGSYQTFSGIGDFGLPKNNNEFRIWPQLVLLQTEGKLKIEQRYRSEFRFTSNGYRNRFRYRFGLTYPFGKLKNGSKPFQTSISNEIFFTTVEPYFERNRLQLTLNYKVNKTSVIQVGYLHQFDYKINDETGRDFLIMGIYIDLQRRKKPHEDVEGELKDN